MRTLPLSVDVYRGETVESNHRVHGIVLDRSGDVLESWGDMDRLISPRSSLKPLQALPFVESGAVEAFDLTNEHIALACASHNAEPIHIELIKDWLKKIGLDETDLMCGGHLSINEERAHEMIRNNEKMTALLSDCSGKHTAMLTTAIHQGHPTKDYVSLEHPIQKQIYQTISEMAEYDLSKGFSGTDGCSVPNPAIPLKNLALAFSHFMNPDRLSEPRGQASKRIIEAMADKPYLVAGKDRFDTVLSETSKGNILGKIGAEGNYIAFVRDQGITIFLKAEDGVIERATLPVLGKILEKLKALDDKADEKLSKFTRPVLKNWKGLEIGRITVRDF